MQRLVALLCLLSAQAKEAEAVKHPLVPLCIAEHCYEEAISLGGDNYTKSLGICAMDGLGSCGSDAWACLGDEACRNALACAPVVVKTCGTDIWKMLTQPAEREKLECLSKCMKDGKVDPLCAIAKCSKSAASCLFDSTCRDILECPANALLSCSKPAFDCTFGKDPVCRQNLGCLAHGVIDCWAPIVNMGTDANIARFMMCAGNKCPKPEAEVIPASSVKTQVSLSLVEPANSAEQLLCISKNCGAHVLEAVASPDVMNMLTCALKNPMGEMCSSVWDCLGEQECVSALQCWAKPFETCAEDVWHMLVNDDERKLIENDAICLNRCAKQNSSDIVNETFCVMDNCGADLLNCSMDTGCRAAVKCMPNMVAECAMPTAEAYLQQKSLRQATKCLAYGLEGCGRTAVELVRNPKLAEAFQCASQCTRDPMHTLPLPGTVIQV